MGCAESDAQITGVLSDDLRWASALLAAAGIDSPRVDAEVLAADLMGVDRSYIPVHVVMGAPTPVGFQDQVMARARRVPLQHLTGKAPFYGLEIQVGPGVFIPRFETELVVELVIRWVGAQGKENLGNLAMADLCTGSGAIAVALAHHIPQAHIHAFEMSPDAFVWAQRNTEPYPGIQLQLADARQVPQELVGCLDVVVSNPPYIPEIDPLESPEVRDYDPAMALWGGGIDGMRTPRLIIHSAAAMLKPGGFLVMEHASSQKNLMVDAFETHGLREVRTHYDLTGQPRVTTGIMG